MFDFARCKSLSRQLGYSVLEISLVVTVAAVLTGVGYQQYKAAQFRVDMQKLSTSVDYIFSVLNSYYYLTCHQPITDVEDRLTAEYPGDPLKPLRDASGVNIDMNSVTNPFDSNTKNFVAVYSDRRNITDRGPRITSGKLTSLGSRTDGRDYLAVRADVSELGNTTQREFVAKRLGGRYATFQGVGYIYWVREPELDRHQKMIILSNELAEFKLNESGLESTGDRRVACR